MWPIQFAVYASSGLFVSRLRTSRNTRYRWLAKPYRAGTCTLPGVPSLSWRANDPLHRRKTAGATQLDRTPINFPARCFGRVASQRVTYFHKHFSNKPPPNRTCKFPSIRLSSRYYVSDIPSYVPLCILWWHSLQTNSSLRLMAIIYFPHAGMSFFPLRDFFRSLSFLTWCP